MVAIVSNQICPWTNVVWKNVAQTDVAWTNVAWTNVARADVAWTNVAWSNGTGPLFNSQGWFHKLEMCSTVLSLGGWVGGEKLKLMLTQSSCAGAGTELGNKVGLRGAIIKKERKNLGKIPK